MNRLEFALQARKDLQQIYDYIAEDNPSAAFQLIEHIEKRCKSLSNNPGMGRKRDELCSKMRSVAEGNYLIFYFSFSNGIEVSRVLHSSRDIEPIFGHMAGTATIKGDIVSSLKEKWNAEIE